MSDTVVPYTIFDEDHSHEYFLNLAKTAIWDLYLKAGITHTTVELRGDLKTPDKIQAVVMKDFTQNALWLLPWNAYAPCTFKDQSHKKATTVELSCAGETDVCWVPATRACSWSAGGEDAADSVVVPYWAVDMAKEGENRTWT